MVLMDRIEIKKEIMHGKPVISGTRIPVSVVLGLLAQGINKEDIIKDYYPDLSIEDIHSCLQYAHLLLEEEEVYA